MRRFVSALIVLAAGCAHPFEEARIDEPHAIVKVRLVHHTASGPALAQQVRWNDYEVAIPSPGGTAYPLESLRAIRVRPELSRWRVSTTYYHEVSRMEMQTRYRTEYYSCGTRSCSRQVSYQELVRVTDRIVDGACDDGLSHTPRAGGIYVVQLDYFAPGRCTLQCLRQLPADDGTFRFVPCGADEPPGDAMIATSGGESARPPLPPQSVEPQPVQSIETQPAPAGDVAAGDGPGADEPGRSAGAVIP